MPDRVSAHELDKKAVRNLFDKLAELLEAERGEALKLMPELESIPHTEELISYIEDLEFELALTCLNELKKRLRLEG